MALPYDGTDKRIGQLMRDGITIHYAYLPGGIYVQHADKMEVAAHLWAADQIPTPVSTREERLAELLHQIRHHGLIPAHYKRTLARIEELIGPDDGKRSYGRSIAQQQNAGV